MTNTTEATPTRPTAIGRTALGPTDLRRTALRPTGLRHAALRHAALRRAALRPTVGHRPAGNAAANAVAVAQPAVAQPGVGRIAAIAATLTLLVAVLSAAFALPARAATLGGSVGDGVGTAQHPVASQPSGSAGALVFGALCLGGIVVTAGGVLWYTVRTRRTLDADRG
jgi:hypothetical protein